MDQRAMVRFRSGAAAEPSIDGGVAVAAPERVGIVEKQAWLRQVSQAYGSTRTASENTAASAS
jgi:hypothetical protein